MKYKMNINIIINVVIEISRNLPVTSFVSVYVIKARPMPAAIL